MLKLNRDSVLKSFMEKVNEAKRLRMKDVKLTMKEMDDLAMVVYELMSEQITKALEYIEMKKEEDEVKKPNPNKKRRVIEKIDIDTHIEPKEKVVELVKVVVPNGLNEKSEPTSYTAEVPLPKIEEVIKEVEEPEDIEETEDEEDDDNTLYGGTW